MKLLLAQKVQAELEMGKAFDVLAKKYSDDISAKQNGGALGWVSWGRTMDAFQNEAFVLNPEEFSGPVLTDFGYHIIYVKNKRPSAFDMLSGEELEDAVYNVVAALFDTFYDKLQVTLIPLIYHSLMLFMMKVLLKKLYKLLLKKKKEKNYWSI